VASYLKLPQYPGANQVDGFSEKTARKSNLFFEKGDDIIRWILREFKV
jgi:hypothetical protein